MALHKERHPLVTGGAPNVDPLCWLIDIHNNQRTPRRQALIRMLHAAGPRPVLEACLELEAGHDLDEVLERFARISPETYRALGADVLPIDEIGIIDGGAA